MGLLPDRMEQWMGARLLRLPRGFRRGVARTVEIDGQQLDPEVRFALQVLKIARRPPLNELAPEQARQEYETMPRVFEGRPATMESVEDRAIDGPAGEIGVRVYTPEAEGRPLPVLVYYHGGGWTVGSLDTHDVACRLLARDAGCIVVSVDYRLGPEDPFPAAVDDSLAAFRWAVEHAGELGGDPERVAVAGDSAGGNLAAIVCHLARDDGGPQPRFQLLLYPGVDAVVEAPSYDLFADGFFLTRDMVRWFLDQYVGDADRADPRISVLRSSDFSGLPPAMVAVAGFDVLRDEGLAYAQLMREAGVDVQVKNYVSLIHGFVQMTGVIEGARQAMEDAAAAVRVALG